MSFWICKTCAVEHATTPEVCAVCADERQWVPAAGQQWTTLAEMTESGFRTAVTELEPDLFGITSTPGAGIGQQTKLVRTPQGNLLWDPIGFIDDEVVRRVRELGEVVAIAASHPHMFGVQVEWSRALGDAQILVAEPDLEWVARPDSAIKAWSDTIEVLPGVTMTQPGGHFPGSGILHWAAGAEAKGVILSSDTAFVNPDRVSVSFMRSYPNRIPLSAAVVERVTQHLERFEFDRLYGNFETRIDGNARELLRRSADRHIGWVRGDFDHLT